MGYQAIVYEKLAEERLIINLNSKNPYTCAPAALQLGQISVKSEKAILLLTQTLGCSKCTNGAVRLIMEEAFSNIIQSNATKEISLTKNLQ